MSCLFLSLCAACSAEHEPPLLADAALLDAAATVASDAGLNELVLPAQLWQPIKDAPIWPIPIDAHFYVNLALPDVITLTSVCFVSQDPSSSNSGEVTIGDTSARISFGGMSPQCQDMKTPLTGEMWLFWADEVPPAQMAITLLP